MAKTDIWLNIVSTHRITREKATYPLSIGSAKNTPIWLRHQAGKLFLFPEQMYWHWWNWKIQIIK